MALQGHKDLIVWQKSMDLVVSVYELTQNFPQSEIYGLTSQMRRSAVSIPSNIAEGSKRKTKADFLQFIAIAFGSGAELETQVEIAKRLKYGKHEQLTKIENILTEVLKMLFVLSKK